MASSALNLSRNSPSSTSPFESSLNVIQEDKETNCHTSTMIDSSEVAGERMTPRVRYSQVQPCKTFHPTAWLISEPIEARLRKGNDQNLYSRAVGGLTTIHLFPVDS
ncbi:hypothetical protein WN51_02982 [Melipona quadrifasciata]|uniref:Uncharacterized protein n=1 Tax=Melipona quadrifasciata TaxID=166423 RepID=A0A0M8ZVK3_9HYME|nr:hypothetical protein WN51_02982 [Melipona quadrifasciata]